MSKNVILNTIRKNKVPQVKLPEIPDFSTKKSDYTQEFAENLKKAGGELVLAKDIDLQKLIDEKFKNAQNIVSVYESYEGTHKISEYTEPHQLQHVDLAVISGQFGVAENGAVWIEESDIIHRALPFITENLIIVLQKNKLLENMHEAYAKIKDNQSKFAVFISGPSKTADIEQSLVIGAHGAKSLYVYMI